MSEWQLVDSTIDPEMGWYWWRENEKSIKFKSIIFIHGLVVTRIFGETRNITLPTLGGEILGPLEEPK